MLDFVCVCVDNITMKQEIKFRAWDKRYKEMTHDVGVLKGHAWDIRLVKTRMVPLELTAAAFEAINKLAQEDIILMQYTGLKDKNGKEIYEGDIVKSDTGQGAVEWMYSGWYAHGAGENKDENIFLWALNNQLGNELEVIGNIYENPELLDEKTKVQ